MLVSLRADRRRGGITPLVVIVLFALLATMALAIDVGLVVLARNQAQAAADIAAMAAVRELNGDAANNNNHSAAAPTAKAVAAANQVLGQAIDPTKVSIAVGWYAYDSSAQRFTANFDGDKPAGENWSAVRVEVEAGRPTFFARVFAIDAFTARASSTAVHRPRDIALILDFSGSMRFSSMSAYPVAGDKAGSMNPDPAFPKFGHWSVMADVMYRDVPDTTYGFTLTPCNLTVDSTTNGPALVKDFLTRDPGGALLNAFDQITSPYDPLVWACPAPQDWAVQSDATVAYGGAAGKGGDRWPRFNKSFTSGSYARTVQEFLHGNNNNLSDDHARSTVAGPGGGRFDPLDPSNPQSNEGYGSDFKGYSMGPGYYGKTFYLWPPDPRYHPTDAALQLDWRKKFFFREDTTNPVDDNGRLWDSNGYWRQAGQSSSYDVNYDAVIQWIKAGPRVFPPNLRAGRVLYYDSIPDTIPQSGGSADQRFWRGYIDYVIGAGSASQQRASLYGRHSSAWGTVRITPKSSLNSSSPPYMHYNDNPIRPRLHFWFGPLTMLDFISRFDNNWLPGTCHEAQTWQLKVGIQSALRDIEKNHPNDCVGLIYFSSLSSYKTARVPMGRDYARMKDALFFPFDLLDSLSDPMAERRPYQNNDSLTWDTEGIVPSASGYTAPEMGLKVAYNEFGNANGAKGRRGAAKVVILETDGVPNQTAEGDFINNGTYQSYYNVSGGTNNYGNNDPTVVSRALDVVDRICALETAASPGYSTARVPARVHALAFGDLFQQSGSDTQNALDFLLQVQVHGNTSPSSASGIESYKIITGDYNTRIDNLRIALERIMQSGVQVSLIR